jgi:hypothetical protein
VLCTLCDSVSISARPGQRGIGRSTKKYEQLNIAFSDQFDIFLMHKASS